MDIPYTHVDAFADRPFTGNQAAVMPLERWLPDDVLEAIAEENNFAETAFFLPDATGQADYELRWFTPACEIALCGHATLASAHVILSGERSLRRVTFVTRKAGMLTCEREGDGYSLGLPAYPPSPSEIDGISDLLGKAPRETYRHDGGYNLAVFDAASDVRALSPDFSAMAARGDDLYICTAPGEDIDVVSRVFVPGAGVDEDSVTGAAHAVLTPFWADRLGRARFTAFQASARGGRVDCRLDGDTAWLGGQCVTVVEGVFRLPD